MMAGTSSRRRRHVTSTICTMTHRSSSTPISVTLTMVSPSRQSFGHQPILLCRKLRQDELTEKFCAAPAHHLTYTADGSARPAPHYGSHLAMSKVNDVANDSAFPLLRESASSIVGPCRLNTLTACRLLPVFIITVDAPVLCPLCFHLLSSVQSCMRVTVSKPTSFPSSQYTSSTCSESRPARVRFDIRFQINSSSTSCKKSQ